MKNRLTQIQNCKFRDRLNHCPRQTIIFEESLSPTEYQKNNWKSSWNLQIWPTCSTIEPIHSWGRGHLVKLFVPIFLAEDEMLPICTELRPVSAPAHKSWGVSSPKPMPGWTHGLLELSARNQVSERLSLPDTCSHLPNPGPGWSQLLAAVAACFVSLAAMVPKICPCP